jgi:protein-ribulosamine 3-kinase
MIPQEILDALPALTSTADNQPTTFTEGISLGGGCINEACIVNSENGPYFIKWNHEASYPAMFLAEARGLHLLSKQTALRVPGVIASGSAGTYSFLLLEYLERGRQKEDFWTAFAAGLATLHQITSNNFGLDHDNYIGSLPQRNRTHSNWPAFFMAERLEPQSAIAFDCGLIGKRELAALDTLGRNLDSIFPNEKPALVHGDLWSGNYLIGPMGEPCLIDPAVYYGHREMDLGMSLLFGGFPSSFYDAYQNCFPLEKGWRQRADICNLYPLLVHVNLFGGGYAGQVRSILRPFMG